MVRHQDHAVQYRQRVGRSRVLIRRRRDPGRRSGPAWLRFVLFWYKKAMGSDVQEPGEQGDPELQQLAAEIERLEAEERKVSALRQQIHDRLASFPNDVTARQERELSARRVELHAEIDRLRAELVQRRLEHEAAE